MKGVVLSMKEHNKYQTIKNLVDNNGNKQRAAIKLGVTVRTINRMIVGYKKFGKEFFRHKNKDNKPITSKPNSLKARIIDLFTSKYIDFNISHFNEKLKEIEGIDVSYSFVYKTLKSNNLLSKRAQRKTKKQLRKKIELENKQRLKQDVDTETSSVIIQNNEIDISLAHPRQERSQFFGEVVQLDASYHLWFGNKKAHLHLAIDDSTSMIVGAYFDTEETLNGYYHVLHQILTNHGAPLLFLTDRRTIFEYESLKYKSLEKDTHTQFSFACSILGTDIECTSVPQSKGKVERSFNTHQDRLINELKLRNVTTLEEANNYLKDYVHQHNKKFALPLNNTKSVFETQINNEEINLILAIRSKRIVDNGNTIKFKNNYYQTYKDGKLVILKPKSECIVIEAFDGSLYLECADEVYDLKIMNINEKVTKVTASKANVSELKTSSKTYTPSSNHPWKNERIKSHQRIIKDKIRTLEDYYDDCLPIDYL